MPTQAVLIPDKQGRLIDIDVKRGGWKITTRERDTIYQAYRKQFPDGIYGSDRARAWFKLEAKRWGISPQRIRDFVSEAVKVERGELSREWGWWVGCSKSK